MSEERCENCFYGDYQPALPNSPIKCAFISCWRFPKRVEKDPNDKCGEHRPRSENLSVAKESEGKDA